MSELLVYRDGEPDPDYMPKEPTKLESIVSHVEAHISGVIGEVALQGRMWAFDKANGTNYREIRNELKREQRTRRFEQSIGLIAVRR